jgi:hypothetical protein
MKEMVRAIFAPGLSVDAVAKLLDRPLSRLSRCRLKPLRRAGTHPPARRLKLSNARAEAQNNKVKLIGRRALACHSAPGRARARSPHLRQVMLTLPREHARA